MIRVIRTDYAAPLGDIRALTLGDEIQVANGAQQRRDWSRYAEAIAVAVGRGAEVRQVRDAQF